MRIKNQMIYLLEMWAKIKSRWAKIPKWMQIVIKLALFVLAIYFLSVFHSSKKELVDSRIHEEASEFNKNKQVKQCRMKHCYKDMKNCSKNDKYKKCVEQRIERAKENFEK